MNQINLKNAQNKPSMPGGNDKPQIMLFLMSLSDKDKLAYGLIAVGVIFIIIGAVLW